LGVLPSEGWDESHTTVKSAHPTQQQDSGRDADTNSKPAKAKSRVCWQTIVNDHLYGRGDWI